MRASDVFTVAGVIVLVIGVALIYIPAGLITAGVLSVLAGEQASARAARRDREQDERDELRRRRANPERPAV